MNELAAVDQSGGFWVVIRRCEHFGVIERRDLNLERSVACAVRRVVSDRREEVFEGEGGVVYSDDFDVGSGEAEAEESSAWRG